MVITLGQVLQSIEHEQHWPASVFVTKDVQLGAAVSAEIVRYDRATREALTPIPVGMSKLLSVQDVQDIVSNARQQLGKPTTEQLVEALQYYVTEDAFIEFPKLKRDAETAASRHSRG